MHKPNILIVWSNYYKDLAERQLEICLNKLKQYDYNYQVETVEAGTYEIPNVIQHYHRVNPFDGYLPLSLLLKGRTDHYEFIWEHVKECFIQFALDGLTLGNGVISAPSMDILCERVENGERVQEAINAVDYLIRLKNKKNNKVAYA
ncbi:6,7-dimethyl-8-ribityllumazine synthase [Legionella qingyii]|uniref:6,7-dimethyl-8-ribityllumazine synthase n=1 Tax=Legionella qingyii TaxID=2184757 RepID=A0A317UAC7_9GAMM|nr:6,7-dimethyl-8-ribityllumazine synthase [Legionella qingyii]PWY57617.1 6,7-dimethyl-8-ribityllumazine synthase [Legionella qingyii]RUR25917.1 6,7-dimethyl-8-ribityllumazine synthase [Legionella qingyii]RUR29306.1 6,7-dimethyl-8-ribityllumazine synthase [Legionella qingyii]